MPRRSTARAGRALPAAFALTGAVGAVSLALALPRALAAQQPGDTVWTTPEGRYEANALQKAILGPGYRELWAVPIPVPVLDLATYGGGLEPLRLGGGQQTRSLRFQGGDGQIYTFRSIDKDVSRGMDPHLRGTVAEDVLQDQISSLLPLSAMVVSPLLDSAGVFNPGPSLFVMPDDPALGEFREDFRGMLGWVEVRPDEDEDDPDASFAGAERVISSPRLYERLEEGSDNQVDARAFLRARLMDFLVGDWDRHPDQWRWAGFTGEVAGRETLVFRPVPRDRDWALARIDGLLGLLAPLPWPQYVGFGPDYPTPFRISWNGRGLDRRFLSGLSREDFRDETRRLMERVSPEVIDAAVATLPESYREVIGEELTASLRSRREALPEFVEDYYDLLAGWVDVEATDEDEWVVIRHDAGGEGAVSVALYDMQDGEPRAEPWFERTFLPEETQEVRLYLMGGDDEVQVEGEGGRIVVRVIGGGGDDRYADLSTGNPTRYYDHRGDNEATGRAEIDESDYDEPEDAEAEAHGARARDWGARWIPLPGGGYNPDEGFFFDLGGQRTGWGFREWPFANRLTVQAGMSTSPAKARLAVRLEVPIGGTPIRNESELRYRGARFLNYYGLGNETSDEGPEERFRAVRSLLDATTRFVVGAPRDLEFHLGPRYRRSRPRAPEGSLLAEEAPYGFEAFNQLSVQAGLTWNRERPGDPPPWGLSVVAAAEWVPPILDVESRYWMLEGRLTGRWTGRELPLRPTLLVQAGGSHRIGDYPYHDAAYLGGASSLRGFREQRFGGDSALRLGSELRLAVTELLLLFPGELGILGLADVGRVFLEGEESDRWHHGVGGGVWASWLEDYTISASVAWGGDDMLWYITAGLPL